MIEGIQGIQTKISSIQSRISEIQGYGKVQGVFSVEAKKEETTDETETTAPEQSFTEILNEVMQNKNNQSVLTEQSALSVLNSAENSDELSSNLTAAYSELYQQNQNNENDGITEEIETAINRYADQYDLDPELLRSVIRQESQFNPNAVSPKGAMGLMQLMPQTAEMLGVSDPYSVDQNIEAGSRYLRNLIDYYDGNLSLGLAAYNAGTGAVEKYNGIPEYQETENYVRKVINAYKDSY